MLTAIVVDDDIDLVSVFCEYLKIMDIEVVGWGYDGKEAVELYEQKKPDIAFLDLAMPRYDGFFATEEIKRIDPTAKVVIVTASPSKEARQRLQELGAKIIVKPFEMDKVLDAIEDVRDQTEPSRIIHTSEQHGLPI